MKKQNEFKDLTMIGNLNNLFKEVLSNIKTFDDAVKNYDVNESLSKINDNCDNSTTLNINTMTATEVHKAIKLLQKNNGIVKLNIKHVVGDLE